MGNNVNPEVFFIILICLFIFYGISEIFGRSKHIGRGWTFALLSTSFVFGIIALILSPSSKKEPTHGNLNHKIFGWISIVMGVINIITLNPLAFGFIALGIYLIELSKGNIQNKNPKFYFETNHNEKIKSMQKFSNNLKTQTPKSEGVSVHSYYIIKDNQESAPLSFNELKNKKISEETYVWRKGFSDWTKASEIDELKNIIIYSPPPFNPNKKNHETVSKNEIVNLDFMVNNKSYSQYDIEMEFENGNYFIDKNTIIIVPDGSQKLLTEIPELLFLLDYFPPEINPTL